MGYLFILSEGADTQTCPGSLGLIPTRVNLGDILSYIPKDPITENPHTSRVL